MVFSPGLPKFIVVEPVNRHALHGETGLLRPVHASDFGELVPFEPRPLAKLGAQAFYQQTSIAPAGLLFYKGLPEPLLS